jgi:hypothetical protein
MRKTFGLALAALLLLQQAPKAQTPASASVYD